MVLALESAGSVLANYRRMYKQEYRPEVYTGTDEELLKIINAVGVAPSGAEQDEWTLCNMHYYECNKQDLNFESDK